MDKVIVKVDYEYEEQENVEDNEVVRMYARRQRQQIPLVLLFWPGDHPSDLPLPVWQIRCSEI